MGQNWPVVRRDNEYTAVHTALVDQPGVCGIVIIGDAGVGKTTLARLVTRSLPRVQWVAGTESARSIPLGVFAHLVGSATSRDPVAFLATARETIISEGHSVIGVDDAHLLDQLSATLLHQLALDGSVRIVATVRAGESVPDAITSLWKDGYLQRLHLTPFTKEQCVGLIEQALRGRVEGLSADLMWDASGGNALFVRHLVEGALEAGTLRQVRGVWQLRGRTAVTSELASLLDGRVDQLPDAVLHALRLLTFCEPLDLDTLAKIVGDDAVDDAESRGLIRVIEDHHRIDVRFNHPLFGEVIRRRLGMAAGRRLRGELVRALKDRPLAGAADRIRLAELTLDSDQAADVDLFVAAARDAIALTNITLGERLARAAVARGGGLAASELLARSMLWQGNAAEAEETLSPFDPGAMNELELARWGTARIANLQWSMGDAESAEEVLALLKGRLTYPALRLLLDGVASASLAFENQLADAVALSERVLADPEAPPAAVEWAVFGGALALALIGRVDEVAVVAARGHEIETKVDGLLRILAAFGEVRALALAGEFDTAAARSAGHVQIWSAGQYLAWGITNVLVGTVGVARGRFAEMVTRMEQTVAALTSESAASWSFPARLMLAQSYCALGRVEPGAKMVAELRTRFGRHVAVFGPQLRIAEAWHAAAEGNISSAIDLALDAARLAEESGQKAIEMLALHDAVRFGDESCLRRLIDVAGGTGGRLAQTIAEHAKAVLDGDPEAIHSAARRFEEIGAMLSAADAAAHAAVALEAAGDRRHSVEAAAMANRLAAECGGLRTPALELAAHPLPLTAREREIANLVAAGLSNREIADRLFVSVRTVEGHLYRACIKLDISDREQLGTVIRSGGK
ncbi:helix-turn-helix transcriptional regulator [Mycobacterium sp.]|jgi:DNA-binding NarL/FixJ family response regulator|uniref:helix-turn-helix transcriptional regulator n=1 Tax=Mycobacterium sp. TaxID=1785 RepID=UPI002D75F623|nr:LuxR C-terminal-related transcriptional regulator [Mycobacterium sp.]HZA09948.1 LuxR C-terminal-related transcriptional regulator [Mycobacterium sp.]